MSIKVLVVDDSFMMRVLISDMLNSDPEIITIDTAKSGVEALQKLAVLKPDCITLDLIMPEMDGYTTLLGIMSKFPTPTIILTGSRNNNTNETELKCLAAGATDFIQKPFGKFSSDIEDIKNQLLSKIKLAVSMKNSLATKRFKSAVLSYQKNFPHKVIIIGASTGGPQVLETLLANLPSNFPVPILIAQHMPSIFFPQFINRLKKQCKILIKMAEDKEIIRGGHIYFVPSGYRLLLEQQEIYTTFNLQEDDSNDLQPCIDEVMISAAQIYGAHTIGIILTGVGNDGLRGMKVIKNNGGKTIAQDESAFVFGMPKAIIDEGIADFIMPHQEISEAMVELLINDR